MKSCQGVSPEVYLLMSPVVACVLTHHVYGLDAVGSAQPIAQQILLLFLCITKITRLDLEYALHRLTCLILQHYSRCLQTRTPTTHHKADKEADFSHFRHSQFAGSLEQRLLVLAGSVGHA